MYKALIAPAITFTLSQAVQAQDQITQPKLQAAVCHWYEECSGYTPPPPVEDPLDPDYDPDAQPFVVGEDPYAQPDPPASNSTDPATTDDATATSASGAASTDPNSDGSEDDESSGGGGMLSPAIVYPVMLAGNIFQLMLISLIGTGFQIFLWSYMTLDLFWDTVVRLFLGTIGFLKPLAWLAIWSFKLPTMPIIIFGWSWTVLTSVMAFPVSGWMLFFGGSGCFLRWGHNCHFPDGKRFKDRSYWQIADLAWLMKYPSDQMKLPPNYDTFKSQMLFRDADQMNVLMKQEGQNRRKEIMQLSPYFQAKELLTDINEYITM